MRTCGNGICGIDWFDTDKSQVTGTVEPVAF
jgi:hypothetical protein